LSEPLLVETVTGRSMAELRQARDSVRYADLVELRLDGVVDLEVAGALEGRTRPSILTCRPAWEGGQFDGSEDERHGILAEALRLGAEYVDVEWRAGFAGLVQQAGGARVVLSSHDFHGIPDDLRNRVRAMRSTGSEIIKVAVMARRLTDGLVLRELTRDGPAVVIAMGDAGIATRVLAAHFGSCWTYAGEGAAPGQIAAERMVEQFRFRGRGQATRIFGVVGNPVMQSLSPTMHNAAFAALGCDAVFLPLQAADFNDFLCFADALAVAGASVTIPFKIEALRASAVVDDIARRVGAANTLRRGPGGWEATNTDVAGFLAPLGLVTAKAGTYDATPTETGSFEATRAEARPYDVRGKRASVLGAGGVARSVVAALVSAGAHVTLHARRSEQAGEVAELFNVDVGSWPPEAGDRDLLVNCTPLGGAKYPADSPLPGGLFRNELVYDVNYAEADTPLVRDARCAGCRTLDGLDMLIAQAERQFAWWTGRASPPGLMEQAARAALHRT
jgi:3-dehydroquinate dehydratase / shikimate dehydrogenase